VRELCTAIGAGAGAMIVTEEAISLDRASCIVEELNKQPAWSDLPVILLTRGGPESKVALRALRTLGNVVLLERPVRIMTLIAAVRAALRARRRQYEIRENIDRLRDADRRKDEFLAMLAHELRNPLAPIRNAVAIMRTAGATPAMLDRAREMTERQVVHMTRLVDDLLEASRVSRGKIALKTERVDLGTLLTRVADTTSPVVTSRNHRLLLTLPPTRLTLLADPARLEQVFVNLITNAAKYTPPGGRIEISAEDEMQVAVVRVRDTGIGIAAPLLAKVFDLFVQAEQGFDRSEGGLGIGLTLVKALVELHGGTVDVASEGVGRGTEFAVRLPLVDAKVTAQRETAASSDTAGPPRRILVIDDNDDAAESLAIMLRLAGHQVVTAHDGTGGIAAAHQFQPDVVFLDIGLPGLSGYEVAQRLRAEATERPVTLVALTGYGQEEDRRHARSVGFDHHLVKPPDPATIIAVLASTR
jgi:signal transduction histidine kinase